MKIEKVKLSFRSALEPIKKVDKLVLHHPAHKTWGIQDIHNFHKNTKKWNGIGYNYFITKDGRVFEGRGKHVGAHCEGQNSHTLGICFQGNFDLEKMPDAQVNAGGWLVAQLVREYGLKINDVVGHKDMPGAETVCPGKNFRMADVKKATLASINPAVKKTTNKIYRVQVGAFGDKKNAENLAVELKKKGYASIVTS